MSAKENHERHGCDQVLDGRSEPYVSLHLFGTSHYATPVPRGELWPREARPVVTPPSKCTGGVPGATSPSLGTEGAPIMRLAVAMLAILTTGGLSLAFADPPATPVAPESRSTTAQSSTAEGSKDQNQSLPTRLPATAAPTAAETPAAARARDPHCELCVRRADGAERLLQDLQGYTAEHSESWREAVPCTGREIPPSAHRALPITVLHCVTVAQAEAMAREGREVTEHIQRNTAGCLTTGTGGSMCR